jgi:hypothetical protein
MNRSQTT